MKLSDLIHLLPLAYLTAGYISAYFMAQRSIADNPLKQQPSRAGLWSAKFMLVLMPFSGIFAAIDTWDAPALPLVLGLLLGGSLNIFYFFGSCRIIMANKQIQKD